MEDLSIIQVRNLARYIIENPPKDKENSLRNFKVEFSGKIPIEIQPDVQVLLAQTTYGAFAALLPALVTKINQVIPPVHTPTSLTDILNELVRFAALPDPMDREILMLEYIPMIKDRVGLPDKVATDRPTLDTFIVSMKAKLATLSLITKPDLTLAPPPFKELFGPYATFRANYYVSRSDLERQQSGAIYLAQIAKAVSGTPLTVVPASLPTTSSFMGFYAPARDPTSNTFMLYVDEPTFGLNVAPGWTVSGMEGINGTVTIVKFTANVYSDAVVSPGPPAVSFPYVSNAVVISDRSNEITRGSSMMRMAFVPPVFDSVTSNAAGVTGGLSLYDPRLYQESLGGKVAPLRNLSSNVFTTEGREVYHTVIDRGSGTGALIGLAAIGAQEPFLFGGQSLWIPRIDQHTPFVLSQRLSLPLQSSKGFLGRTIQVDIDPRTSGDLISNMYLQCALPALPTGSYYTELVGRAIIQKAEFLVDGIVYESITDDWYIIRDQLFLDGDEKLGMYKLISNGTPEGSNVVATSQLNLIVPLEFFFCRRFTHMRHNKKPFFPLCALTNSSVSVRFTFNSNTWITNSTTAVDLIAPRLLIEEITLSPEERIFYQSRTMKFKIPRVWKDAVQQYTGGVARINLTANFPVSLMTWFVRNKRYEKQDAAYYNSRYAYGYTTDYIISATPVTFFNGVSLRYIDTIDYATLYLNNNNVLSNFPGGLYYTFKQAIDHGLSVPTKNIYMYSFSERPFDYNQGGALDFSKLNSQTTHLDIKFLDQYAPQIQSEFSLNLFYYGYVTLQIGDGQARLVS